MLAPGWEGTGQSMTTGAQLLIRSLPGSPSLTALDVLRTAARGPFPCQTRHGLIEDMAIHIAAGYQESPGAAGPPAKWLLHGPPGAGKTMLLTELVSDSGPSGPSGAENVYLDMSEVQATLGDADFGTLAWLRRMGTATPAPGDRGMIVIDALDEGFFNAPRGQVLHWLTLPAFARADVLTCRTSFYDRYLRETAFARGREVGELLPWREEDALRCGTGYIRLLDGRPAGQEKLDRALAASEALRRLCRTPLNLSMAVAVITASDEASLSAELTLLGLYERWMASVLTAESAKPSSVLSAPDKVYLLEALAWRNYENFGGDEAVACTADEILSWLSDAYGPWCASRGFQPRQVAADLLAHSLLVLHESPEDLLPLYLFRHQTIQDLLVARYAYHCLEGVNRGEINDVFRVYLGPDIWSLLQDMLMRLNRARSPVTKNRIIRNGLAALQTAADSGLRGRTPRDRVLREQLGHYLGHLGDGVVRAALAERIRLESDPWVRRGTVIGLSFGGARKACDDYVDFLRQERDQGGDLAENGVNRGAYLTFYGDQIQPEDLIDIDLGHAACERTVHRLVRQLLAASRTASWRLDLYTLFDIALYRSASRSTGRQALLSCRVDLQLILRQHESDEVARSWPETAELRDFLAGAHD